MARFVQDITLNKPEEFVTLLMNDYLQKNSYVTSDWKGEPAYRTGDAVIEGYKYLKWSYANGVLHLEAWLKGTFGGEAGFTGFAAMVPKKHYKQSIDQLIAALQQPVPEGGVPTAEGVAPAPIPVQTVDNHAAASRSMVLGILSIVCGILIPLAGFILGCVGLPSARMGAASSKAGQAKVGKICCIAGMIVSAVIWLFNLVTSIGMMM